MSEKPDVAVIVGSLRKGSLNRKTARALIELAEGTLALEIVEIGGLALYDADREQDVPPSWVAFRERIAASDAVLFVTPEYNRSVPGALKNALDVGSQPAERNAWRKKPGAIVSVSPGAIGGFGANHHLRQTLVSLDVPTMGQPEAYVGNAAELFDDDGRLTNASTRKFLGTFVGAFAAWIEANTAR